MNELTGLPELPPKHFWRVTDEFLSDYRHIHIRRKLWFGSVKIADYTIFTMSPYGIRHAANSALDSESWKRYRQPKTYRQYLGDYPPRSLKD